MENTVTTPVAPQLATPTLQSEPTPVPTSAKFGPITGAFPAMVDKKPSQTASFPAITGSFPTVSETFPAQVSKDTTPNRFKERVQWFKQSNFGKKLVDIVAITGLATAGTQAANTPEVSIPQPVAALVQEQRVIPNNGPELIEFNTIPSSELKDHSAWGVFNDQLIEDTDWTTMSGITGIPVPEKLLALSQELQAQKQTTGKRVEATDPRFNDAVVEAEEYIRKALGENAAVDLFVNWEAALEHVNPGQNILGERVMKDDERFFEKGVKIPDAAITVKDGLYPQNIKIAKIAPLIHSIVLAKQSAQPSQATL